MSGEPYLFSEDSALIGKVIEKYSGERCLEIGAGNGGIIAKLSESFSLVVGTDIVEPSMRDWRTAANFILADRATCMRSSSFDFVVYNPPYLAEDGAGDQAVEGGRGLELPIAFLHEALRAVKRTGAIVFLLNNETKIDEIKTICARQGFAIRLMASRRVFFEELSVYEATTKS